MAEEEEEGQLTEGARQLYRKARVPHKFCAYCGARNEADADRCEKCNKDISWMRVPEPVPYSEPPPLPSRPLPKSKKIFTPRAIVVIALILILLAGVIIALVILSGNRSDSGAAPSLHACPAGTGVVMEPAATVHLTAGWWPATARASLNREM